MKYKFKVGDKVTCTAGYYKFANGVVFRLGNGDQPFYFIEWETRNNYVYDTSWSHENHLVLRGNFKGKDNLGLSEKETEMNETRKMEVGKLYKTNSSKRIVKALATSSQGDTFVEVVGEGGCVGFTFIITPKESSYNWEEYTKPKKLYINIYEFGVPLTNYTGCYSTVIDADKAKDVGVNLYGYKFIKRIETEI